MSTFRVYIRNPVTLRVVPVYDLSCASYEQAVDRAHSTTILHDTIIEEVGEPSRTAIIPELTTY